LRQVTSFGSDHLIDHPPCLVVQYQSGRAVHDPLPEIFGLLIGLGRYNILLKARKLCLISIIVPADGATHYFLR
jgi:hypothetical protein